MRTVILSGVAGFGFFLGVTPPAVGQPKDSTERLRPAFSHSRPNELQFSDGSPLWADEDRLARRLSGGDPAARLAAARALWEGHSRRYAPAVLRYLAGPPPGGEGYRALQREVEAALQPPAVRRELTDGDYLWGAWLAFLRPHKDLVPVLLDLPTTDTDRRAAAVLALGNSGAPEALEPLLRLLESEDDDTAGGAAQALGYHGAPRGEPGLIRALGGKTGLRQLLACRALSKMGTSAAVPALDKLAKDDRYTGALPIQKAAQEALKSIRQRAKR